MTISFFSSGLFLNLKRPVLLGLTAGLLTAGVTLFMPNQYRSEGRILPVETKSLGGNLGGLSAAAAAFGVNIPSGEGSDVNAVDILGSRWLRERLLQTEFQFKVRSWCFGSEQDRRQTLYTHLDEKNIDRALKRLENLFSASRDLKTKMVSLSMESRSPELSQQVVRRAIQLLEAFVQQKGRTRGGAKAAFAEARLKEARVETVQAEDELRRFLDGNRNYLTSPDPSVRLRGLRLEAELKLRQQLITTLAINREQALMEEKNDVPILNVLDGGNLPIDKNWPPRSIIVLLAAALVTLVTWAIINHDKIHALLTGNNGTDTIARPANDV